MKNKNQLNEIIVSYESTVWDDAPITSMSAAETMLRKIYLITRSQISLKEYFFILLLNRSNRVIGYYKLSEGGITSTIADIRIVFATALKCLATGIILCHNHPSKNVSPSDQDKALTKKFREAGNLLDITIIDHLILTTDECYSFIEHAI